MFIIKVRMKKLGKQRPDALVPVSFDLEYRPKTVRELITALVSLEVRDYNARKDKEQLLPFLTREEIAAQADRGKIAFGMRNGKDAGEEDAIANAIQCFEDGIYRIFADQEELKTLEEVIPQTEDMVFTFIRLTMLSGW